MRLPADRRRPKAERVGDQIIVVPRVRDIAGEAEGVRVVMTCKEVKEQFLDMTTASYTGAPAAEEHLRSCAACAGELASLRQTMALLDEWQAPEPSPYFNARLRAR